MPEAGRAQSDARTPGSDPAQLLQNASTQPRPDEQPIRAAEPAGDMPETILPITGADGPTENYNRARTILNWLLRLHVVDVKGRFLWRRGESAFDALLHSGHQDAVAEPLPTLL
jgi:hypothetical protein